MDAIVRRGNVSPVSDRGLPIPAPETVANYLDGWTRTSDPFPEDPVVPKAHGDQDSIEVQATEIQEAATRAVTPTEIWNACREAPASHSLG